MESVIFLDIDGVLNNENTIEKTPAGYTGIDDLLLENLKCVIERTGAKIVLSSSWKEEWDHNPEKMSAEGQYLENKLGSKKISIVGKIEDIEGNSIYRAASIERYLRNNKSIKSYLVIDDEEFDFAEHTDIASHLLMTNWEIGFQYAQIDRAVEILDTKL